MFGKVCVKGIITALSPIHQGGNEKTGSVAMLNRIKFVFDNGGTEEVPIISGNSIKGYLRRLIMKDMLNIINYDIDLSTKGGMSLYHSLFAGGVLETVNAKDSGIDDIALKSKIISTIPAISLFGITFGNQMITGKLKVGFAYPICKEIYHILSKIYPELEKPKLSFYDIISYTFQTRRDEIRKSEEDESKRKKQAVQMLVDYEVYSPGTQFCHVFYIEDPEDIELSCFARVLELWKDKPFLAGKSGSGFGNIDINYDFDYTSNEYIKYLKENTDKISSVLDEIVNFLEPKSKKKR